MVQAALDALQPDALLMDEPFSALDVLTAENLRGELMQLWQQEDFPTKSICIVTHNLEEAVLLADRVVVLGANPGHIAAEVEVRLRWSAQASIAPSGISFPMQRSLRRSVSASPRWVCVVHGRSATVLSSKCAMRMRGLPPRR